MPVDDEEGGGRIEVDLTDEPLWAYGFDTPAKPGDKAVPQAPPSRNLRPNEDPAEQTMPRHLEGSSATYSLVDVRDGGNVIDWFPGDHPPMPGIIARGPARDGQPDAWLRLVPPAEREGAPGKRPAGRPPRLYVIRQIDDFRNGLRYTADPRKPNTNTMIELAKAMTDEEVKDGGGVLRSDQVDAVDPRGRDEPGAEDAHRRQSLPRDRRGQDRADRRTDYRSAGGRGAGRVVRNPHSGFVAYVPVGSIEKGKDLVTTGGMKIVDNKIVQGKTTACGTCHGWISWAWPTCRRSPAGRRATWSGRCGTCSRDAERRVRAADEAGGGEPHRGRHGGDRRVRGECSSDRRCGEQRNLDELTRPRRTQLSRDWLAILREFRNELVSARDRHAKDSADGATFMHGAAAKSRRACGLRGPGCRRLFRHQLLNESDRHPAPFARIIVLRPMSQASGPRR